MLASRCHRAFMFQEGGVLASVTCCVPRFLGQILVQNRCLDVWVDGSWRGGKGARTLRERGLRNLEPLPGCPNEEISGPLCSHLG